MARGPKPVLIVLTAEKREALQRLVGRRGAGQAVVTRARIVLAADAKPKTTNKAIAAHLGISRQSVIIWRQRFAAHRLDGLVDAPRSGAPRRVGDEAVEQMITLTLEEQPRGTVVGAVRSHGGDAALCLPEQAWRLGCIVCIALGQNVGSDLAGVGVHGDVELAPLSTGAVVPVRIPLALPEQLQACAVQHQVHGLVVPDNPGLATGKDATTPGKRGAVGHSQIGPEQGEYAATERLGLAQGQVEDEPQGQHQLDRRVGVSRLPTRRGPARGLPAGKGCLVEPERQVAASPQPSFIGRPVRHPPALLRDAVTASGIVLERHPAGVAERSLLG